MNQKKAKHLRHILKLKMTHDKQRFITKADFNRLKIRRHQDIAALKTWKTALSHVKRAYKQLNREGREGLANEWSGR